MLAELLQVGFVVASQDAVHESSRARALVRLERNEAGGRRVRKGRPEVDVDLDLFRAAKEADDGIDQIKPVVKLNRGRVQAELWIAIVEPRAILGEPHQPAMTAR